MRVVKELLLNPVEAIKKAKAKKDVESVSSLLVIEWLIIGLANAISFGNLGKTTMAYTGITIVLLGIPMTLFISFLLFIIMRNLSGRGSYYKALTSVTYGLFAMSIGILIASPFFYVPKVGFLFTLFIFSVSVVLSLSTLYKSVKELFETDIMTTWIGIGFIGVGLTLAVYLTILLLFGGTPNLAPIFSALKTWNL